jgi:flagella basal body P-ring formation protein FlgA
MTLSQEKSVKKLFFTALAVACIFASSAFAAFAQGKISVRILAEVTVDTEQVKLGDIAAVAAGSGADDGRIQSVSLGFSPRVGMTREISRENISLALAAAGFSDGELALDIPAKVLVKRAAQTVPQNTLREAVEKAILPQFEAENISAKITKLDLPEKVDLPTGNVEVRVVNFSGITNFLTPSIISLEIKVDGKILKRISANVMVEAFADVLLLNRDLASGTRIAAADVQAKNIRLEKNLSSYIRKPSDLAGKKLLKNLPASSPLTTDAVAADAVIKTGDSVSIIARSGGMQIAVSGEARANGRIGDRIAVKNTQSGVILQAVVIDEGTVKLSF